jgi:DNA polymerase-1
MYRAYHAFRGKGLSNQEGQSTHAVYVFVTMLRKLIADHHPAYIAASFDLAGPTFRDAIAADYKATRAAMPDDLAEQIAWVHEACRALGVPIVTAAGYEADDVIGTLARQARERDLDVAIVSIDKDFFQLVRDGVRVFDPREDGSWYDTEGVVAKFGVKPSQVVDVLALVGDASDNVAGVPGIGKKGAIELMSTFGSFDALYERAAELKPRQRTALEEHRETALRSRELVTIRTDVPIALDLDAIRYQGPSHARCYELFSKLGFRSLVSEFAPTAATVTKHYALVRTESALADMAGTLKAAGRFALRVIADRPEPMQAAMLGLAFSSGPHQAWYVPVARDTPVAGGGLLDGASDREDLTSASVTRHLQSLLEDPAVAKVSHDLKVDTVILAEHGISLQGLGFDTMLASYLLDATGTGHSLEEAALEHLTYRAVSEADLTGRGTRATPLAQLAPETVLDFACERADLPGQLETVLAPRLREAGLTQVNQELEIPLIPVLAGIERVGVRIDIPALEAQSRHLEQELAATSARIFELAGEVFNVNSPKQLGDVLFEKLKLPALKKTGKTRSASTAVEVLEELAQTHELPRLILDWRGLHKLKSTYIDALPLLVHPKTGRVHTNFNQAVAATGRLSSSDPNLQNIPIRTELGREIRRAFVAAPSHVLISADYSQIELRVLAHLAGDDTLIEAFRAGEDIHDRTALRVFGTDSGLGPHELRRRAKIINYALLYGKTAFTLSKDIGVGVDAAQAFIEAYFAGFPRVRHFIDATIAEARASGAVKTMFGRRRLVPELNSRNGQLRAAAERATVNMPIQGTAADILKRAMIDVDAALRSAALRTRMILTVHDELLFEAPAEEADAAAALVREKMEGAVRLTVPLTVDVGIADNWRDAKG